MKYEDFITAKTQHGSDCGFEPIEIPDSLFPFQKKIVEMSLRKGRSAMFEDCGLGKTIQQLVWADNVAKKTKGRVLILTPLAVSTQTAAEARKFNIDAARCDDGRPVVPISITNYEKLHKFSPSDFSGVVCDESSILKSFDGKRKDEITTFMRKVPYRLLCTATAAPNDYVELGTSSEALGYLGHMDMLAKFFKNDNNNCTTKRMYGEAPKWRFKGHSQIPFWQWVTSWAIACRSPSDIGFDDDCFILPKLIDNAHVVKRETIAEGLLFNLVASTLPEQREEKKGSVKERCEKVLSLVGDQQGQSLIWCQLNDEAKRLKEIIPESVEISGSDSDEKKESAFMAFARGEIKRLITKPKIGAWGMNWQNCAHVVYFPSHSYEQFYQCVRRCWRFGQKNNVIVDTVMSEGEVKILQNMKRKASQASEMFTNLVREMNNSKSIVSIYGNNTKTEVPSWL